MLLLRLIPPETMILGGLSFRLLTSTYGIHSWSLHCGPGSPLLGYLQSLPLGLTS